MKHSIPLREVIAEMQKREPCSLVHYTLTGERKERKGVCWQGFSKSKPMSNIMVVREDGGVREIYKYLITEFDGRPVRLS